MSRKIYSMIERVCLTSQNIFKGFLKMNFRKKFSITYIGCWIGFISMVILSKILVFLSSLLIPSHPEEPVKTVGYVVTKKFEVVSSTVSLYVDHSYFSVVLSYFVNNSMSCIVILLAYTLVAYLYRREVEKDPNAIKDYINALILFYLITVINPLTGIVGYAIDIEDLPVVVPHGLFEFAGLALSIVTGLTIAERILPVDYPTSHKGIKRIFSRDIILMVLIALIFIGFAALLEPIDWMVYQYSIDHNLNVAEALVKVYISIFLSLIKP